MQMLTFKVYDNSNKAVLDAYTMLSTNIHISSTEKKPLKTFALTSCNPREGKTFIAISLAITLAQTGLKVLLVDADMRKPAKAKRLNSSTYFGLTDYLIGEMEYSKVLCGTNINNLTYLPSGSDQRNQIGLLCSQRFEDLLKILKNNFDIVIFDTPVLTSVVDGAYIASKVDATLLVVEIGSTSILSLKRGKEQLEKLNANILGVVLNKMKKRDYKYHFGEYNYFFNTERFLQYKNRVNDNKKEYNFSTY